MLDGREIPAHRLLVLACERLVPVVAELLRVDGRPLVQFRVQRDGLVRLAVVAQIRREQRHLVLLEALLVILERRGLATCPDAVGALVAVHRAEGDDASGAPADGEMRERQPHRRSRGQRHPLPDGERTRGPRPTAPTSASPPRVAEPITRHPRRPSTVLGNVREACASILLPQGLFGDLILFQQLP